MRCRTAERFISLKLDGELKPSHEAKLQVHLGRCISCHKLHEDYRGIVNTLRSLPDPEMPPQLHHMTMNALPRRNRKVEVRRFRLSMAAAALGIVFSLGAGTFIGISQYDNAESYVQSMLNEEPEDTLFGDNSLMAGAYDE